ncbi:spore protein [Beduinella massiliensis]|uniref:spore protein n=1 Tax=Beduinella massiliensis TaxID=1852363 RepID=UPI000C8319C6
MKPDDYSPPDAALRQKYEAARELGLMDRLLEVGWAGLTAAESGRVGGRISAGRRRKKP